MSPKSLPPLGGRWPRPRPRPDEGRACRYCPLTDSWFVGNGLDRSVLPCQKHDATGKPRAIRRDFMRCARPDVRMGQDPSLQTETRQRRRGRTCPARSFPAYARLPYTAGPGMPGPYGTATIKKRLFALCIVGWGLDPTAPPPGNTISRDGPRSGQDRSLQSNGKQAFSCSQNKKTRGPLCLRAARNVLM